MIIRGSFDFWPQNGEPVFMPGEVPHEIGAGVSDADRVRVDRLENIEQVLDVHIL